MKKITIVRADGAEDIWNPRKLERSLKCAGASSSTASTITKEIERDIVSGMTTADIYRRAFSFLKKQECPAAARYSIKQAIMAMGPTGYPFEQLLGRLLAAEGYTVSFPDSVRGRCVSHEVDVVAAKDGRKIMVEAKFHNQPGFRSDVKTALYVRARYEDLAAASGWNEGWLITNTKFTSDAIRYGSCAGLHLLGWGYPAGGGLESLLTAYHLWPITILTTLSTREKRLLMEKNIVVCRDLIDRPSVLKFADVSDSKAAAVISEVKKIIASASSTVK